MYTTPQNYTPKLKMDSHNTNKNFAKPPSSNKLSISIFVISLPLLYVSLLHIPLSSLFKDTAFLFLISNSIIIIVAAESGVFTSSSSSTNNNDALYDDYIRHVKTRCMYLNSSQSSNIVKEEEEIPKHIVQESSNAHEEESSKEIRLDSEAKPEPEPEPEPEPAEQEQEPEPELELETEVVPKRPKYERRWSELSLTKTEISKDLLPRANTMTEKRSCAMEENDYMRMSDEELNKRVEDFIRRINREIRLQERMSAVF